MSAKPGDSVLKFLAVGLIVLGLVVAALFGLRSLRALRGIHGRPPFPPPAPGEVETDVNLIRGWMTVPFVGRMYHVHPKVLFEALNIPPEGNQEKSLDDLNRQYYPKQAGFVLEKVKEVVQANQPPLPPEAPHQP